MALGEKDWLACCGSVKFAQEMVSAGPFSNYQEALNAAKDIWFNKVDVFGWLEAFAAHPQIGESPSQTHKSPTSAQWSKGEQSTALATATDSTLQELYEWNARYREKFGFVFLIFASGRSTPEILAVLKRRYQNRPIVEFKLAAEEQMKITELRLSKLFPANTTDISTTKIPHATDVTKAGENLYAIIHLHQCPCKFSYGFLLLLPSDLQTSPNLTALIRSREHYRRTSDCYERNSRNKAVSNFHQDTAPITTHILDVARGAPAAGVELEGCSTTDKDGRSGQLMKMADALNPGVYRISFVTGKYNPDGFFRDVSIVFEVRESQKWEHFHVPLLVSPFSICPHIAELTYFSCLNVID
ncbi:hypothetical protein DH2020_023409 [Rehmannia glutinosa]|uniref:2-oxo-4-hydroxy-4-carboxy-5-ureidoimidazoline decarboxylase n=1 Tax=Rehmannia glutinosa TaxID=99300 RepID=A0ABR0W602_REHGL